MKYKYIDTKGNEVMNPSENQIKQELNKSYKEWLKGSGDSAIEFSTGNIIIFKVEEGIFLMTLSDYSAPLINKNQEANVLTHYVGGEPMNIPDICLCDEETAFKIISYYIKNNGLLHPDYQWIDIFDYLPD